MKVLLRTYIKNKVLKIIYIIQLLRNLLGKHVRFTNKGFKSPNSHRGFMNQSTVFLLRPKNHYLCFR